MEGLAFYRNGWERAAESIAHPAQRARARGNKGGTPQEHHPLVTPPQAATDAAQGCNSCCANCYTKKLLPSLRNRSTTNHMEEKNRRDALLAAVRFGRAAHAARLALANDGM